MATVSTKLPITAILAVKNEEANIASCIRSLAPAEHVLVVDSHSTDGTAEIAADAGAEIVQFEDKGGYPKKRQWALDTLSIDTPWILLVDADEIVPPALWAEIASAIKQPDCADAYLVVKQFHFMNRRFRFGGFSHSAVLLFKKGRARFERLLDESAGDFDMEVHERLLVDGSVGRLRTPLLHEDFKGLEAYRRRHEQYAVWEARVRHQFLTTGRWGADAVQPHAAGNVQERRRFLKAIAVRVPFEPFLWFLYHYVLRLGFLEGRPGWIACRIRMQYIRKARSLLREMRREVE